MAEGAVKRALIALFLLAGCATVQAQEEEPFRARGNEPFWSVTVANGRMTYARAGEAGFSVRTPARQETEIGYLWRTPRLTVEVMHQRCSDGMSDMLYPADVRVTVGGEELRGCGGEPVRDELANSEWQIVEIDGNAVSGHAYQLSFTRDRISGQAGCNRFNGTYQRGDEGDMDIGPLAVTRMACPEPRMGHERFVLNLLGDTSNLTFVDNDNLVISADRNSIKLRRVARD
jgi:uncharacterized membrane protein